jgi:NTP pyrophosphatase (non-canonical NTP hydrolase)
MTEMNYDAIGKRVHAWRQKNFGRQTPMRNAHQVVEECSEVQLAVIEGNRVEMAEELADVILAVCGFAEAEGIKVQSAPDMSQRTLGALFVAAGCLSRCVGKSHEGIRSESRGTLPEALSSILGSAENLIAIYGFTSISSVVESRIQRMESLDFTANRETGGVPEA